MTSIESPLRSRTTGDVIRAHASSRPDAAAFVPPGREALSYALAVFIDEARAGLNDWGIGRGDRVALAVAPRPEMAVAHIATSSTATSRTLTPTSRARGRSAHP